MPNPPPTRPIIICGYSRTGTTFLQTLLNCHPEIHLSTECQLRAISATPLLCAQIARLHRREHEQWRGLSPDEARVAMLRAVWYYSEPDGLLARRYGNKTPGNERHFQFFESVFRCIPPLYIYMVRDPADVLASFKRMPWGRDEPLWLLIARFEASLFCMRRFRRRNQARLLTVSIDRATTMDGKRALVEEVFRIIGEEPTPEVWRFVDQWPIVNPSENRLEVDTRLYQRILRNPLVRRMRRELGYRSS